MIEWSIILIFFMCKKQNLQNSSCFNEINSNRLILVVKTFPATKGIFSSYKHMCTQPWLCKSSKKKSFNISGLHIINKENEQNSYLIGTLLQSWAFSSIFLHMLQLAKGFSIIWIMSEMSVWVFYIRIMLSGVYLKKGVHLFLFHSIWAISNIYIMLGEWCFGSQVHMLSLLECNIWHIFEISEKFKRKIRTYVFTCCVCTKSFHDKSTCRLAYVKKKNFGAKNKTFYVQCRFFAKLYERIL
jgi:hypothetical protein